MSYDFPFTIDDVVHLLDLRPQHIRYGHYQVDCPFCLGKNGQPDQHGHMDINTVKNTFRCNRCNISGGMLTLYGYYHQISRQEAYAEIMKRLAITSAEPTRSSSGRSMGTTQILTISPETAMPSATLADIIIRDKTYGTLLQMLRLNDEHYHNLLSRGLSSAQIMANGYASMPSSDEAINIARQLLKQGCHLQNVPGFFYDQAHWQMRISCSGLLIPVRDEQKRIQGLQIRSDCTRRSRYIWLSSADKPDGTKAEAALHIAGSQYAKQEKVVYLTEGPLKADVASFLTNQCFIACPGTSHYKRFATIIPLLQHWGIQMVYNAFDMDSRSNPQVAQHTLCLNALLTKAGFLVRRLVWSDAYKGIDDYLLAARSLSSHLQETPQPDVKATA